MLECLAFKATQHRDTLRIMKEVSHKLHLQLQLQRTAWCVWLDTQRVPLAGHKRLNVVAGQLIRSPPLRSASCPKRPAAAFWLREFVAAQKP